MFDRQLVTRGMPSLPSANGGTFLLILQLSMVDVALAYYAASGHLTTLAENITDQFHKGLYQSFVDVSLMVSWNQVRWGIRATQREAMIDVAL